MTPLCSRPVSGHPTVIMAIQGTIDLRHRVATRARSNNAVHQNRPVAGQCEYGVGVAVGFHLECIQHGFRSPQGKIAMWSSIAGNLRASGGQSDRWRLAGVSTHPTCQRCVPLAAFPTSGQASVTYRGRASRMATAHQVIRRHPLTVPVMQTRDQKRPPQGCGRRPE